MADGLAADAAANPMIRYVLRNRSRYEAANNSYCRGLIDSYATDLVGSGPRLQMETGDDDADAWIEAEFSRWSRAIKLPERLRTMAKAKVQDGEAFALMITNPGLQTPVKLDVRVIEADQVRFVDISLLTVPSVDGIRFDDYGNPVSYHVLRVHPGFWSYATGYIGFPWEYDVWPAKFVMHWFRQDRPGQHRGIPEISPALALFAQLRRYTLAVLQAAETAADFAMWMKTPTAVDDDSEVLVPDEFDKFPLARNIVTTLPDGYDIGQTKAEQPTTTHEMFVRTILREIGRVLKAPYQKVAGDASQGNFSTTNHDHLDWWRGIEETHKDLEYGASDRLLAAWLFEARSVRIGGADFGMPYMPANVRRVLAKTLTGEACDLPEHTWNWQAREWPNPAQQATADETNLRMGLDTFARIWSGKGQDCRKALAQNAKFLKMTEEQYIERVLIPNLLASTKASAIAETDDTTPGAATDVPPVADKKPVKKLPAAAVREN
jgi:capsid protein